MTIHTPPRKAFLVLFINRETHDVDTAGIFSEKRPTVAFGNYHTTCVVTAEAETFAEARQKVRGWTEDNFHYQWIKPILNGPPGTGVSLDLSVRFYEGDEWNNKDVLRHVNGFKKAEVDDFSSRSDSYDFNPKVRLTFEHGDDECLVIPFKDYGGKPDAAYDAVIEAIEEGKRVIDLRNYQGFLQEK
jgi:hypothetical protein